MAPTNGCRVAWLVVQGFLGEKQNGPVDLRDRLFVNLGPFPHVTGVHGNVKLAEDTILIWVDAGHPAEAELRASEGPAVTEGEDVAILERTPRLGPLGPWTSFIERHVDF